MAQVIVLPGIERRDLVGPALPPEQVFAGAIDQGITDVVVIGRHRDGSLYVAGSLPDMDRAVGMLMSGVWFLTSGNCAQGIADEPEPTESA